MEYRIELSFLDDSLNVVLVTRITVDEVELTEALEPLMVLVRSLTGEIIENCYVVAVLDSVCCKVASEKSATATLALTRMPRHSNRTRLWQATTLNFALGAVLSS